MSRYSHDGRHARRDDPVLRRRRAKRLQQRRRASSGTSRPGRPPAVRQDAAAAGRIPFRTRCSARRVTGSTPSKPAAAYDVATASSSASRPELVVQPRPTSARTGGRSRWQARPGHRRPGLQRRAAGRHRDGGDSAASGRTHGQPPGQCGSPTTGSRWCRRDRIFGSSCGTYGSGLSLEDMLIQEGDYADRRLQPGGRHALHVSRRRRSAELGSDRAAAGTSTRMTRPTRVQSGMPLHGSRWQDSITGRGRSDPEQVADFVDTTTGKAVHFDADRVGDLTNSCGSWHPSGDRFAVGNTRG